MGDKCEQPCQIVCVSQCFFGLSAYLASVRSDYHELQTRQKKKKKKKKWKWKMFVFFAQYYKMFSLHFSKMVAQKMTSRTQASEKKENKDFHRGEGGRKVSTVSWLIDVLLHEILIVTGCLRRGRVQTGICIPKPLSARPLFHLWYST